MNSPINCPICGDPLVNTFNERHEGIVYKNCRLRPDHIFSCMTVSEENGVEVVGRIVFTLSMSPMLSVELHPGNKTMGIDKNAPSTMASLPVHNRLPFYVEPDFSNYPKLVNKIKIYILFS